MNNNILFKFSYEKLLIIITLGAYFIPNFYAIDRIGNQWFYLSIISIVSFFYLIFANKINRNIKFLFQRREILFYFFFIIWALISIFFSLNKTEALATFNQYFTVFACYILLRIFLNKIEHGEKFILNLLFVFLIIEIFLSFMPILNDLGENGLAFRSVKYSGATANVNITAFSFLYKLPVILYFLISTNNNLKKFFLTILIFVMTFIISILGSRASFLGLAICLLGFTYYLVVCNKDYIFRIKHLFWVLLPLIMAGLLNLYLLKNNDNDFLSRASTININTTDGSVDQRLKYYSHTLKQFAKTPLTGVGVGNWKFYSIDYNKKDIDGFIVPYHAHNDFLQILAELGIIGLFFYGLFLFFSSKILFSSKKFSDNLNIFLFASLLVFLLDSSLNFPIARPVSQLFLISLLGLISLYEKKSIS